MTKTISPRISPEDRAASAKHGHDYDTLAPMLEAGRFDSHLNGALLYVEMRLERSFASSIKERIENRIKTRRAQSWFKIY